MRMLRWMGRLFRGLYSWKSDNYPQLTSVKFVVVMNGLDSCPQGSGFNHHVFV